MSKLDRRELLKLGTAASAVIVSPALAVASPAGEQAAVKPPASTAPWNARWIWYPGQLACHLHTNVSRVAFERVSNIGYPGFYQRPEYVAWFRLRLTLAVDTPVRWAWPLGRTRVRVDGREGDISVNHRVLPAGPVEILVIQDMMLSLPCFLLEGGYVSTGDRWEASLDGEHWTAAEFAERLASPSALPDKDIDGHQQLLPRKVARLSKAGERTGGYELGSGGEVLLDFHEIELGTVEFTASGTGELQVAVGESMEEATATDESTFEQAPLVPLRLDSTRRAFVLPERAIRFVRFHATQSCRLEAVSVNARIYPVEYRGSFESSDARLNDIWKVGAATLHTCIHDTTILDGIKRDALVWLFDQNIDFDAVDCVFFDPAVVRNTLLTQTPPAGASLDRIGLFELLMYYVIGFGQDYLTRGDASFSQRYRANVTEVLDLFTRLQDERGFISARAFSPKKTSPGGPQVEGVDYLGEYFPDWAAKSDRGEKRATDLDCAGTPAYAQMLILHCFEIGALLARQWGDTAIADRYAANAAHLRANITGVFWDHTRGAFINGFDRTGTRDPRVSPHAQTWGILLDLVPQGKTDGLFSAVFDDPRSRPRNISMQAYYELMAYTKAGRFPKALEYLKKNWGWMLDNGFTRFIEDIRPADGPRERLMFYGRPYGLSLNHGWTGATAVSLLMRGTLGLRVVEPGYRLCELRPNWKIFDWVKVSIPTPHGSLALDYNRAKGAEIQVPGEVRIRVVGESGTVQEFAGPGRHKV
jgi:hypothetical protein